MSYLNDIKSSVDDISGYVSDALEILKQCKDEAESIHMDAQLDTVRSAITDCLDDAITDLEAI